MWRKFRARVVERVKGAATKSQPPLQPKLPNSITRDSLPVRVVIQKDSSPLSEKIKEQAALRFQKGSAWVTTAATNTYQKSKSSAYDAIRTTSNNVSSRIQLKSSAASERIQAISKTISHAAQEKSQAAVVRASESINKKASEIAKVISDAARKSSQRATGAIRESSNNVSESINKKASEIAKMTSDAARKSSQRATGAIRESSREAAKVATESITKRTFGYMDSVRTSRNEALRWLWWWSLAAVGVYGLATTLPKELIRYGLGSTKEIEEAEDDQRREKLSSSKSKL